MCQIHMDLPRPQFSAYHLSHAHRDASKAVIVSRHFARYHRSYNCRHAHATSLIMANGNHKWGSLQMGHSVEMFQKKYTKWIDGDQSEAEVARLEANLKNQIVPGLSRERVTGA